jgi:hypothetical protein
MRSLDLPFLKLYRFLYKKKFNDMLKYLDFKAIAIGNESIVFQMKKETVR